MIASSPAKHLANNCAKRETTGEEQSAPAGQKAQPSQSTSPFAVPALPTRPRLQSGERKDQVKQPQKRVESEKKSEQSQKVESEETRTKEEEAKPKEEEKAIVVQEPEIVKVF